MEPEKNQENYKPENNDQQERRSIRDLRIARPQQKREVRQVFESEEAQPRSSFNPWILYAGGALIACFSVVALLPVMFPEATVTVSPKKVQTTASPTIQAYPTAQEGALQYVMEEWTVTVSKTAAPTTSETVTEKASGTIRITNTNGRDQKLIKNTRFESKEGKIYRVRDSITVPALGTLEVKVFADEGGDTYNVASTSFTLPGLKNSDLFTKVTAETVTALQGGFSGTRKSISADEKKKIHKSLEDELIEAVRAGKDYSGTGLLVRKTTSAEIGEVTEAQHGDDVVFTLQAKARAAFVQMVDLGAALAAEAGSRIQSKQIAFAGPVPQPIISEQLDQSQYGKKPITILAEGTHTLVYTIDRKQLAKDLAGAPRDGAKDLLGKHPEIEKAIANVRPFWKSKLPSNPDNITIKIEGEVEAAAAPAPTAPVQN
ncbi:MAG: hypothetical protein RI911_396 [Candidatus Parcubacteria bacterium]|jgi:hypothetical protein